MERKRSIVSTKRTKIDSYQEEELQQKYPPHHASVLTMQINQLGFDTINIWIGQPSNSNRSRIAQEFEHLVNRDVCVQHCQH